MKSYNTFYQEPNGQLTFLKELANKKEKKKYRFSGPVYIKDRKSGENEVYTSAVSIEAAVRNVKYWLSKRYSCSFSSVFIDASQVKEV